METSELLRKVRKIEIKTRGLSQNIFAGEYHSMFKGRGMTFSEVREFQYGDTVRDIDWNVTARFNKPFIKVFEEERELTLMLVVDISDSQTLGSRVKTKREQLAEIAAVLAFSAMQNNDKIGLVLFTDTIEKIIPPQKGKKHILRIIRELLEYQPVNIGTNVAHAVEYVGKVLKRRSTVFVLSDFTGFDGLSDALRITGKKHDVLSIRTYDTLEVAFPNVGIAQIVDTETKQARWINTSSKEVRNKIENEQKYQLRLLEDIFEKARIDYVHIPTDSDYIKPLIQLFSKR